LGVEPHFVNLTPSQTAMGGLGVGFHLEGHVTHVEWWIS